MKVLDGLGGTFEVTHWFPGNLLLYAFIADPLDKILESAGSRVVARVEDIGDFIGLSTIVVDFDGPRRNFGLVRIRWLDIGVE